MNLDMFAPPPSAVISDCGRYRYRLDRAWATSDRVCWIMLNPSTADANCDDPTLRRVLGFSQVLGFGKLVVVNLFAWRATDPAELPADIELATGPDTDHHIARAVQSSTMVICGWGTSGPFAARAARLAEVLAIVREAGLVPHAMTLTKDGSPGHPLYLRSGLVPHPLPTTAVGLEIAPQ